VIEFNSDDDDAFQDTSNICSAAKEKVKNNIKALQQKIEHLESQSLLKDELKTINLQTSRTNYLDPRITVAWCKKHAVNIEKLFNKSLLQKFPWAYDVDKDWQM